MEPVVIEIEKSKILSDKKESSNGKTKTKSDVSTCAICIEKLEGNFKRQVGKIDSCDHKFCAKCIKEWSNTRIVCPICKKRFYQI